MFFLNFFFMRVYYCIFWYLLLTVCVPATLLKIFPPQENQKPSRVRSCNLFVHGRVCVSQGYIGGIVRSVRKETHPPDGPNLSSFLCKCIDNNIFRNCPPLSVLTRSLSLSFRFHFFFRHNFLSLSLERNKTAIHRLQFSAECKGIFQNKIEARKHQHQQQICFVFQNIHRSDLLNT